MSSIALKAAVALMWPVMTAIGATGFSIKPSATQSGKEMLRACQFLQRGMHVEGTQVFLPPDAEAISCWGFMSAVQQYSILADREGKTLLHSCPGPDVTTSQIVGIFVAYALAHPEKLQLPAAAVAYNAMADAFPCK